MAVFPITTFIVTLLAFIIRIGLFLGICWLLLYTPSYLTMLRIRFYAWRNRKILIPIYRKRVNYYLKNKNSKDPEVQKKVHQCLMSFTYATYTNVMPFVVSHGGGNCPHCGSLTFEQMVCPACGNYVYPDTIEYSQPDVIDYVKRAYEAELRERYRGISGFIRRLRDRQKRLQRQKELNEQRIMEEALKATRHSDPMYSHTLGNKLNEL
jgi:hypothetical protein